MKLLKNLFGMLVATGMFYAILFLIFCVDDMGNIYF